MSGAGARRSWRMKSKSMQYSDWLKIIEGDTEKEGDSPKVYYALI